METAPEVEQAPQGTKVYIWSDESIEEGYTKNAAAMTAELVRAAKEDRLVTMICNHSDSDEKATVLSVLTTLADTGKVSCVPLAQMFDNGWTPWTGMLPPKCSLPEDYE